MTVKNLTLVTILGTTVFCRHVQAAEDCGRVLIPKISQFHSSMQKWIALINSVDAGYASQNNANGGFSYGGVDLSYSDAKSASDFYKSKTNYSLSESSTISLLTTELPPSIAQSFVECVKNSKQDITITAPSGSEIDEAFQIKVAWTPTYSPAIKDGTADKNVSLTITNGSTSASPKTISPTGSVSFNIVRSSLDKPISISASIDGRESDFLTFPPKPKYQISLKSVDGSQGPIRRSGHYGNTGITVTPPLCLPPPPENSQYLPSTIKAYIAGAGHDWKNRSSIEIVNATPLKVCASVSSGGVPCDEDKCYHETTGILSATLVTIIDVKN